jgi:hypothetical protein
MIQHEFIAIDESHAALLHINERDQSKNWIVPIGRPQSRDMQLIGGNRILIGHHHGYTQFDIKLGRVVKDLASLEGVTAVRRRPNSRFQCSQMKTIESVSSSQYCKSRRFHFSLVSASSFSNP